MKEKNLYSYLPARDDPEILSPPPGSICVDINTGIHQWFDGIEWRRVEESLDD